MIISVKNLTKKYGEKTALSGLCFELKNGIYALLGPNGAGKTTFMNILAGVLSKTEGEIFYDGVPVKKTESAYLSKLGYLPQNPSFYKNFTAKDFLNYMGALKGIPQKLLEKQIKELLCEVNLAESENKKIGAFSGGMLRRLGIAQALLGEPELLIFDEPTAGLDPKERIRFKNLLSKLSKDKIIIIATHIVSDVEFFADNIILLKNGRVAAFKKPEELLEDVKPFVWEVFTSPRELDAFLNTAAVSEASYENGQYKLRIVSDKKPHESAVNAPPSLNDVYMKYFGEGKL